MSKTRVVKKTGAAVIAVLLGLGIAGQGDEQPDSRDAASSSSPTPTVTRAVEQTTEVVVPVTDTTPAETAAPSPAATRAPSSAPLLFAASGGDGDSWKDRSGREYRLGLVNAPETGECFGAQATARRKALVRSGFRARSYATDRYGRSVSLVALADGRNLNVLLAREGLVDDRYLAEFRHEYEALAAQLDAAFAEARRAGRGLWGGCQTETSPQGFAAAPPAQPASDCHPDYATCIPVKGDGSGSGEANDLDCGDIRQLVRLRQIGVDPYRLDGSDDDGLGCESYA
ncbi:MAG: thermonuclease family protein [Mycobacteriales bacterium]|nr:thermonuclease family protein [Mycobacteriales bacterium]